MTLEVRLCGAIGSGEVVGGGSKPQENGARFPAMVGPPGPPGRTVSAIETKLRAEKSTLETQLGRVDELLGLLASEAGLSRALELVDELNR